MTLNKIIWQFVLSFFATVCFAVFFNSPKKTLIHSGIAGGLGWTLNFIISTHYQNPIMGAFFGSLVVGICGEFLSINYKNPATVYILAGIVPLVPGAGTYFTLTYIFNETYTEAYYKGLETIGIAIAIAFGILITSFFSRTIKRSRSKT